MINYKRLKTKTSIKENNMISTNEDYNNFLKLCLNKLKKFSFDKRSLEREYVTRYKFKTKNSSDIKYSLILEAENNIIRNTAREQLKKYVKLDHLAYEMEKGLFEFSLIHVTINKLQDHFVQLVYQDRLYEICDNLDMDNIKIENKTLLPTIVKSGFDAYFIAFLSPEQLHPKRWMDIVLKKQIRDEALNNFQTTDIYRCKKCGDRRFKITELQMRSADEASSKIHVCMTCYFTFIICSLLCKSIT